MKRIKFAILILFCIAISGCCSLPGVANYSKLYSLTKEEKKIKGGFGGKKKVILIKDFRENEMYDENITALKEEAEKYISLHTDLSEQTKNNLRELIVTAGATEEEVKLLLGEPDKVIKQENKTGTRSEMWIYKINKTDVFTIFIIPLFFPHQAYYLYFKDNVLTAIERHYLEQTFQSTDSGVGLIEHKKSP